LRRLIYSLIWLSSDTFVDAGWRETPRSRSLSLRSSRIVSLVVTPHATRLRRPSGTSRTGAPSSYRKISTSGQSCFQSRPREFARFSVAFVISRNPSTRCWIAETRRSSCALEDLGKMGLPFGIARTNLPAPEAPGLGRSPEFLPGVFVVSIDGASYSLSIVRNKARGPGSHPVTRFSF
jgi:hypothetical protein